MTFIVGVVGFQYSGRKTFLQLLSQFGFSVVYLDVQSAKSVSNIYNKFTGLIVRKEEDFRILARRNHFLLVKLQAFSKARQERSGLTLQEFNDLREEEEGSSLMQQACHCIIIENNGTKEQFRKQVIQKIISIDPRLVQYALQNGLISELQIPKLKDWSLVDQLFIQQAKLTQEQSNCLNFASGAVLVDTMGRVISNGFRIQLGADQHQPKCSGDECSCNHSQEVAILQVGLNHCKGATLYTTCLPCRLCCNLFFKVGIKKIVLQQSSDETFDQIAARLSKLNIQLVVIKTY